MIERSNTNVALDRIFEEVYNMMAEAKRLPFTDCILIDESDMANVLDDLKDAIPREIKNASQVLDEQKSIVNKAYSEADRIVQQAKSEAERIVSEAHAQAEVLVSQEEIVKQANAVAEEIKANALHYQEDVKAEADDYAVRVKHDSLQYADDMLAYLTTNMQGALQGMAENRENIRGEISKMLQPEQPAEEAPAVEPAEEQEQK